MVNHLPGNCEASALTSIQTEMRLSEQGFKGSIPASSGSVVTLTSYVVLEIHLKAHVTLCKSKGHHGP